MSNEDKFQVLPVEIRESFRDSIDQMADWLVANSLAVPPLERGSWMQYQMKQGLDRIQGMEFDRETVAFMIGIRVGTQLEVVE